MNDMNRMEASKPNNEEAFISTGQNDSGGLDDNAYLENVMESVVRVTLAGLGGSMVGLSQEKRLESMRVVTGAAATAAARRKRSPSSQLMNLPLTWAISCMAFSAIIETSRLTSPSSWIYQNLEANGIVTENAGLGTKIKPSAITIADYTIGGAVAGIAGSFGRNTHLRKRLPSSMLRGSQRFFGLVPGIALGVVAGTLQVATDLGVAYLESAAEK
jgi:hypothetical protein